MNSTLLDKENTNITPNLENSFEEIQQYKDDNPLEIIDNSVNDNKLVAFLKAVSKTHTWYHHYTTLEALKAIFENKTFKMTKGASRKLNDWHEKDCKGEKYTWERTYITCFEYSDENEINYKKKNNKNCRREENMAMWGLYGKPKTEAVRISIPQETFWALVKKNCKVDSRNNIPEDEIEDVFSTDVFYAKGNSKSIGPLNQKHINKKIKFNLNGRKLFDYLADKEFTGFVKNYSWHYENEVRIIARIKEVNENDNNNVINNINDILQNDAIFLNIPNELLKTFVITTGPNFTKNKELAKILKDYKIIPQPSVLSGNLNFKDDYDDIGETVVDLVGKIKKLTDK